MKVFISVDIEGVAGVNHGQQTARGTDDYPAARALMAEEANAAVRGAFDGGACVVVVNDSHGDMRNLNASLMDERAELIIGSPKVPFGMMQGIDTDDFDLAMFVGYHARAGTTAGILDHTYSGAAVYNLRVNGQPWGEAELNAAVAGAHGVGLALLTGDDKICSQITSSVPAVRTVCVKKGLGRANARSVHPSVARSMIEVAAREVLSSGTDVPVFRPSPPYVLEMDMVTSLMAEVAVLAGGTTRVGPRTLRFESDDMKDIARCRMAWVTLGGAAGR